MRGETERWDVRHQWRRDNQDQYSAHETRHLTSECARSLLVSFVQSCVVIFTHLHTTSRGSSGPRVCTHLRLWALHSNFSSFHSPSISHSSCCPSISTRICSNTVYSANQEMGSTDESYSLTQTARNRHNRHTQPTARNTHNTLVWCSFWWFGVCFRPSHRGRRRFGWDVSEGRGEEARTRQVVVWKQWSRCGVVAGQVQSGSVSGCTPWWSFSTHRGKERFPDTLTYALIQVVEKIAERSSPRLVWRSWFWVMQRVSG